VDEREIIIIHDIVGFYGNCHQVLVDLYWELQPPEYITRNLSLYIYIYDFYYKKVSKYQHYYSPFSNAFWAHADIITWSDRDSEAESM